MMRETMAFVEPLDQGFRRRGRQAGAAATCAGQTGAAGA